MFPFNDSLIKKVRSVRPNRLVELWPQNEPVGHGVSTGVIRGYHGAYTAVTLGQPGIQGSGLTSAGYDGATSYNNIYTAGLANDNLLLNPGFETPGGGGADIWANWLEGAGDGVLANEVVIVHEGNDSAKLTAGISTNTYVRQNLVVIPGTTYRFRFWTRGDGANAGRYYIYDATNMDPIIPVTTTGVTAAVWTSYVVNFTAPPGCVSIRLYFYAPPVNGGIAYFDATEVRRTNGFLGDKGTVIVPAQVANVGVWTDATNRRALTIRADAANYVTVYRDLANNQMNAIYAAGGVVVARNLVGLTSLDFLVYGITWDKAANETITYLDGVQQGAAQAIAGTWIGDLNNANTLIGAFSTGPLQVWSGPISPVPIWSEALSPDEMRYLG